MTEYTRSDLTEGKSYRFKVSAVNYIGEGSESDELTLIAATVPDQALPPIKTGSTKTSISIAWTAPDNGGTPITGYKVLMKAADSTNDYSDITGDGTLNFGSRAFTIATSLTTGTGYLFKIVTTNSIGDGSPSNASSSIIAAVISMEPLNLQK